MPTAASAFFFLDDAIAKAYELGAPFASATINILLCDGTGGNKDIHYLRPIKNDERKYIPANYDNTQTTRIIISPNTGSTSPPTIIYKMRDKFTFPVGAGLTISNVIFKALDSIAYYVKTPTEVPPSIVKAETTCSLGSTPFSTQISGLLCKGKATTLVSNP